MIEETSVIMWGEAIQCAHSKNNKQASVCVAPLDFSFLCRDALGISL